ncbi:MAG: hypothetical protein WDM76_04635 [Limisphaerales bacterium]
MKRLLKRWNVANHQRQFISPTITECMKWHEKHEGFAGQRLVVVPRPILATALQYPLLKPLLPTDAGYYPKAKGHTCVRERGCPEVIFIYCAEGNGWCEIAGLKHEITKKSTSGDSCVHVACLRRQETEAVDNFWFHAVDRTCRFIWRDWESPLTNPCALGRRRAVVHSF